MKRRTQEDGPVRQRVGPTIKALRIQRGMSLSALAEEAEISPSHLSRMERGLTVPSYDVLDRVADALGSDLGALRQEEEAAKEIDARLDGYCDRLGLDGTTKIEMLRLSNRARLDLARSLGRVLGEDVGRPYASDPATSSNPFALGEVAEPV